MTIIYKDFAKGLPDLNDTLPSPHMMMTPIGRAYRCAETQGDGYYVGQIHTVPIDEYTGEQVARVKILRERFKQRSKKDQPVDVVYAGAAGFINLTFMSLLRPSAAVLFDINPVQTYFSNHLIQALRDYKNEGMFFAFLKNLELDLLERLNAVLTADQVREICELRDTDRHNGRIVGGIFRGIDSIGSALFGYDDHSLWLRTKGLGHLVDLAKNDAIGAVTLDITDAEACAQLRDYLNGVEYSPVLGKGAGPSSAFAWAGANINVFYESNISYFAGEERDFLERPCPENTKDVLRENVASLTDPDEAYLINHIGLHELCPDI